MKKEKFQVGNLYIWDAEEPTTFNNDFLYDYYAVWNPDRNSIWKNGSMTGELPPKSVITVLECRRTKNYNDLKVLSTTGICGWIRVGKEFFKDWHEASV